MKLTRQQLRKLIMIEARMWPRLPSRKGRINIDLSKKPERKLRSPLALEPIEKQDNDDTVSLEREEWSPPGWEDEVTELDIEPKWSPEHMSWAELIQGRQQKARKDAELRRIRNRMIMLPDDHDEEDYTEVESYTQEAGPLDFVDVGDEIKSAQHVQHDVLSKAGILKKDLQEMIREVLERILR